MKLRRILALLLAVCMLGSVTAFAEEDIPQTRAAEDGFQTINGGFYYYENGQLLKNQWIGSGEWKYYADSTGRAVEGMQVIQGTTYYFKEYPWCNVQYGWQTVNGQPMYFDVQTGELRYVGSMAPIPAETSAPDGFQTINKGYYYYENGKLLTNQWVGGGEWKYYVDNTGRAADGLRTIEGKTYYFKGFPWCNVQYGWQTVGGQAMYFDVQTGELRQSGTTTQPSTPSTKPDTPTTPTQPAEEDGFRTVNGGYYYYENGKLLKNQWIGGGEWKYYVDGTGRALEGLQTVDGKKYYFKAFPWCNVQYGWQTVNGQSMFFDTQTGALKQDANSGTTEPDGQDGFRTVNGAYYYYENGKLLKNQWIGGGEWKYYVDEKGRAVEGFQRIANETYYFKEFPWCNVQYGWQTINNALYYFEEDGTLARSRWIGEGAWKYYVDGTGQAVEGLKTIEGKTYYFSAFPACTLQYGTQVVGGKTMHFDTVTGALLDSSSSGSTKPSPTGFLEEGIDVSEHQQSIDWNQVAASGIDYAIVRVLSFKGGTMHIDPYFEQNIYGAKQAGLKVGVYYYTYAVNEAEVIEELTMVRDELAKVERTGFRFDYPVYIDIEANTYTNSLTTQRRTDLVVYARAILEQLGYYSGLYTYTNYALNSLDMSRLQDVDFWVADYRSQPGYTGTFHAWQYTSSGSVPGVQGRVDKNYCYKDYATIIRQGKYNHY